MRPFLIRFAVITLVIGFVLGTIGNAAGAWGVIGGAALFLGLINALVRPLTLRFTRTAVAIATLAIVVAVNLGFFLAMGNTVPAYQFPNLGSALAGAAIVSAVSWPLNFFFRGSDGHVHAVTHHEEAPASETPRES